MQVSSRALPPSSHHVPRHRELSCHSPSKNERIPFLTHLSVSLLVSKQSYLGITVSTWCPFHLSSLLKPIITSASPPTFATGATSDATCTTYIYFNSRSLFPQTSAQAQIPLQNHTQSLFSVCKCQRG